MRRKRLAVFTIWMLTAMLFTTLSIPNAAAQGDAAMMGDIEVDVVPDSQGAGGPITVVVTVPFYGGCCYPLWAYEVQASLQLPEGVALVDGPTPSGYDVIEAKAGGEADYYNFKWTVKSMIPGLYNVSIMVVTENCGSAGGMVGFTISEGCIMTIPDVYPEIAPTNRDINVNVEASSPIEGITIDDVTLFFIASDRELDITKPKNDILFYKGGDSGTGTHISMVPDEKKDNAWKAQIPGQSKSIYLYYWIVATDNQGNTTTSPAYTLMIEDLGEVNLLVNLAFWLPIFFTIFGMILIFGFARFFKNRSFKKDEDRLFVLGSDEISRFGKGDEKKILWRSKVSRMRAITMVVLIAVTVILVVWTITTNLYDEIIYIVEGGL